METKKRTPRAPPGETRKKPKPRPIRLLRSLPLEDQIGTLFNHNLDILGRTIFLDSVHVDTDRGESDTDTSMYDLCVKALTLLEQLDPEKSIKIVTTNFGGILYHAFGIYNRIVLSPCPIIIHGYGPIMSAGSVIFQAGNERLLAPDSVMMLHFAEDSIESMRDQSRQSMLNEHNRVDARLMEIYIERIEQAGKTVNKKKLHEQINRTLYLTAGQAVEMGLADGIIKKA